MDAAARMGARRVPVRARHRPHRLPLPHPHEDRPGARAAGRRARRLGRALRRGRRAARRRRRATCCASRRRAARSRCRRASAGCARVSSSFPFHYGYWDVGDDAGPDGRPRAANELTMTIWDPVSKQPQLKTAAVKVESVAMKIGPLLAHLRRARGRARCRVARGGRAPPRRPRRLPPVPHLRARRRRARRRDSSRSRPLRRRSPSGRPRSGTGSDDLLEDLRTLYLRAQEAAITWMMAVQAAKALRDQELLDARDGLPVRDRGPGEVVHDQDQDRRPTGARGGMTRDARRERRTRELAPRTGSCSVRSPGRSRSASSGSPQQRSSCPGYSSAGSSRAEATAGRSLHPRLHRPAPIHRVDLRVPRPRRRRRDRDGPAQRDLGSGRARHPHWRAGLDKRRARAVSARSRGVAMWAPASSAASVKLVPALVLATAGLRFVVTGLYQLTEAKPGRTRPA